MSCFTATGMQSKCSGWSSSSCSLSGNASMLFFFLEVMLQYGCRCSIFPKARTLHRWPAWMENYVICIWFHITASSEVFRTGELAGRRRLLVYRLIIAEHAEVHARGILFRALPCCFSQRARVKHYTNNPHVKSLWSQSGSMAQRWSYI